MNFLRCVIIAVLALTTVSVSASTSEETGIRARHILAMGSDESILLARGSLRRTE
ncbi:hypothetical protein PF005_g3260 [Phytophthora fragariae]|nr:hypothetical protein PF003_g26839 [Phytophthora fragariae]KAE8946842.1 hypothetical protein PF009_g3536 [Phytophthora fragariae]KAE9026323.1 hypothetical protein PF011_g2607 [Phytophthora fragariae]KAE9133272.1 hypothetical protein PF010_g2870 [Phytophthora fragariae]KAE9133808.1 hypothetical protein PF007_g3180 [Phytophthora fragariae]